VFDATLRLRAAALATVFIAVAGCGSTGVDALTITAPGSSTPSTTANPRPDCQVDAPAHSGIDNAFEPMGDFTVTPICPTDALWTGPQVSAEFLELNAAEISENGNSILRVVAGQVNSGSGEAFVHKYLSELSAAGQEFDPPKILASGPAQEIGEYPVTYFHIFVAAEGYAYAEGPMVVIAHFIGGPGETATAQAAFVKVLTNVFSV
jgi:hypothetical protein